MDDCSIAFIVSASFFLPQEVFSQHSDNDAKSYDCRGVQWILGKLFPQVNSLAHHLFHNFYFGAKKFTWVAEKIFESFARGKSYPPPKVRIGATPGALRLRRNHQKSTLYTPLYGCACMCVRHRSLTLLYVLDLS